MTDNELLLQISDLLDVKLQPMQEEMRQVKNELKQVKNKIEQVENKIKQVEIGIENDVIPRLQNIESCYTDTYDRYRIGVEKNEALEKDVTILKRVVKDRIG